MRKIAAVLTIGICLAGLIVAGFPLSCDASTIYGCYSKKTGSLRIVDSQNQCNTRLENPISWNSVGLVHGAFGFDGTITDGTGFSVDHVGAGQYQVTFEQAFTSKPDCIVTTKDVSINYICGAVTQGLPLDLSTIYISCFHTNGEPVIDAVTNVQIQVWGYPTPGYDAYDGVKFICIE